MARSPDSPDRQMLGLYLHIPFCSAICNYCNFNRGLFDAAQKARYVDALVAEIEGIGIRHLIAARGRGADSIYFGGGTPSLLEPEEIARLVAACRDTFNVAATPKSPSRPIPKASPRHGSRRTAKRASIV
jgi:oxygen-independent coproporphyrinogen-3 oxidase